MLAGWGNLGGRKGDREFSAWRWCFAAPWGGGWRPGTRGLGPGEGLSGPGGLGHGGGRGAGVGGGGWTLRGPDGRSFVRTDVCSFGWTFVWTDGRTENSPLCSIGHHPLRVCCPKMEGNKREEMQK